MTDNQLVDQVYDETDELFGAQEPHQSGNHAEYEENNTADEELKTQDSTPQNAQAASKPYYTAEEMRSLDWTAIDTSRIPPEYNAFYTAMQASYTKKRQAETDELRKLAVGNNANTQPQATPLAGTNDYLAAIEQARTIVRQSMPEADELNPTISMLVSQIAGDIVNSKKRDYERMSMYQNQIHQANAKYGQDFTAVDNLAQQILMEEYPASIAKQVEAAAAAGNFAPAERVLEEAHKRLKSLHSQAQRQNETNVQKTLPPVTIGAGSKTRPDKDDTFRLLGI